jgi:hypothetical protein
MISTICSRDGSKEEARSMLPPAYRRQATVVGLSKFGIEELDELIRHHQR